MFYNNVGKAKEIFMKYAGSHFNMEREGEYRKYKRYRISNSMEKEWIIQYQRNISELLNKKTDMDIIAHLCYNIGSSVRQYRNVEGFQILLDFIENKMDSFDSFTKVLIAETLLDTAAVMGPTRLEPLYKQHAIEVGLTLLNTVANNPVTVDNCYLNNALMSGNISEDQIMKRVQDKLTLWSQN